jgi:acetyl-CoA carboxylase carboxyltransferase component
MDLTSDNDMTPTLTNPFENTDEAASVATDYQSAVSRGVELQALPQSAATDRNIQRQHSKNRMTVWERIEFLVDDEPTILYQNWGPNLDGASLVTAIGSIDGRDVAIYGHDFTVRAGSMDATNGEKLARLFELAGPAQDPTDWPE